MASNDIQWPTMDEFIDQADFRDRQLPWSCQPRRFWRLACDEIPTPSWVWCTAGSVLRSYTQLPPAVRLQGPAQRTARHVSKGSQCGMWDVKSMPYECKRYTIHAFPWNWHTLCCELPWIVFWVAMTQGEWKHRKTTQVVIKSEEQQHRWPRPWSCQGGKNCPGGRTGKHCPSHQVAPPCYPKSHGIPCIPTEF